MGSVAWELSFGFVRLESDHSLRSFSLGNVAWERPLLSLESCRLGLFAWEVSLGIVRLKLHIGIVRLGTLVRDAFFGSIRLGSLA